MNPVLHTHKKRKHVPQALTTRLILRKLGFLHCKKKEEDLKQFLFFVFVTLLGTVSETDPDVSYGFHFASLLFFGGFH